MHRRSRLVDLECMVLPSLLIDEDYMAIAPNINVNQLIASATPGLYAAAPRLPRR